MEVVKEKVQLEKYPVYKDSGVEWVGKVPDHWKVSKLKHLFAEKKKTSNPKLNCGSISFGKVVYKDDEKVTEATKSSYQEVLKGDFLINPLNLNYDLISLRIALSEIDVVVSSGYIVLKNRTELNKRYFNYLLHIFDVSFMKTLGSGVRQTLSFTHIANSELLYPPLKEQTAIATFLDEKCSKIETAILQKQKLIELLKERKQIIIQNAVTKGLDRDVKMKDSGVEWIGEIPEHWEVKKIKHLIKKSFSGGTPSTDKLDYWDGGIPWVSSVDVKKDYLQKTAREISFKGLSNSSAKLAPKGAIIFVTRSGILQHTFPLSILQREMAINQDIKCLILNQIVLPEYFKKIIKGNNSKILVEVRQQAATVESIDMEAFFNLQMGIPPRIEQKQISEYIEKITHKVQKATELQVKQIEKLKEYKSSLIDAAVTGKIKVS